MRRLATLTLILAVVSMAASAVAARESDRETVFRDLAWGDMPEALGNRYEVTRSEPEPGITVYRRRGEITALGTLPIEAVDYHFFDNELMRVLVYPVGSGGDEYDALKLILEAKYGPPTKKPFLSNNRIWDHEDTTVTLVWELMGRVYFSLESKPLAAEYAVWLDAYKKEQAAQAAETF